MAYTTASGRASRRRMVRFTSNTTWTVPDGVTFIQADVCGGGAGVTFADSGNAGANTTVAHGGVTVTGPGMASNPTGSGRSSTAAYGNGTPNTGMSGRRAVVGESSSSDPASLNLNNFGLVVRGGLATTPGGSVTVTIGSGGAAGNSAGGSGFATIYYEV